MRGVLGVVLASTLGACTIPPPSLDGTSGARGPGTLARNPSDVVYIPTVMPVVERMLQLAGVDASDTLYDLGSGDGRIPITAASRRGARGVGIEIDRRLVEESRRNADSAGVRARTEFRAEDLFTVDLRPATAVTLYLLPTLNVRLRPKLFAELRPGTPVVSHEFPMGDWEPDSVADVEGRKVLLWYIPADVSGRWRVTIDGDTAPSELRLFQRYQRGEGVLLRGGRLADVDSLRVRGTAVTFDVVDGRARSRFRGTVSANAFSGEMTASGRTVRLSASRAATTQSR